jgi:S1-C subfamily serine protease
MIKPFLLATLFLFGVSACTTVSERKQASLAPYSDVTMANEFLLSFSVRRSATLRGRGNAIAVHRPGYFLTAAHCVVNGPVVVATRIQPYRTASARVVWSDQKADLAIIRSPLAAEAFYPLIDFIPKKSEPVFSFSCLDPGVSAGIVEEIFSDDHYREFHLNIPMQPGDSGGAIVDSQGHLVGVMSSVTKILGLFTTSHAKGRMIDAIRLISVIENDAKTQENGR